MINTQDPTTMGFATLIVSFILYIVLFLVIQPDWLKIVDKKTKESSMATILLLSYSATFAFATSLGVFLYINQKYSKEIVVTEYNPFPYTKSGFITK